jgi:ubiquinone/menaquinone biosynthesis C-methylase UbiE
VSEIAKFNQPDQISTRFFIEFLDLLDRLPPVKEVRRRVADQMRLKPGAHALDIGSGNGTAARGVAYRVGPEGRVCGMDISETMVAEATARAHGRTNLEFRTGHACALPYADATFDAVRMERVLRATTAGERTLPK